MLYMRIIYYVYIISQELRRVYHKKNVAATPRRTETVTAFVDCDVVTSVSFVSSVNFLGYI